MAREEAPGCSCCSSKQTRFLHNFRHRGDFLRYCTSCLLQFHRGSFCCRCFDVFEGPPPADSVKCSKCPSKGPSIAHSSCIESEHPSRFVCPSCSDPAVRLFKPIPGGKEAETSDAGGRLVIDLTAAKVLLAASRIAAQSMCRAAAAARQESDRKVREAAFAKKRAIEAIERASTRPYVKDRKVVLESGLSVADPKDQPRKNNALAAAVTNEHRVTVMGASSSAKKSPRNGERKGTSGSASGCQLYPTSIQKEANEKSQPLTELSTDHKGRAFSGSEMSGHLSKLNQDASRPRAGSGIVLKN